MIPEKKAIILKDLKFTLFVVVCMLLPSIPFYFIKIVSFESIWIIILLITYELTLATVVKRRWLKSLKRMNVIENNEKER